MNNKITKARVSDHLEYDWFKYIMILVACIVLWSFVFTTVNANKDWEEIQFFVMSHGEVKDNTFRADLASGLKEEGDSAIRETILNVQSPEMKELSQLFQTQGMITSDVLIVSEQYIQDINGKLTAGYLQLTDEVLAEINPDNIAVDYWTTKITEQDQSAKKYGIRLDNMKNIDKIFTLNLVAKDDATDEEKEEIAKKYMKFYLVINPSSTNIGKFGKSSLPENDQALFAVKKFLELYN